MAENKYAKLGAKANLFSDASTGLKVLPKQVVELKPVHRKSKRILKALKHGHLEYAEAPAPVPVDDPEGDDGDHKAVDPAQGDWKDSVEYEPAKLKKLNKAQLVELALHLESEYDEDELNAMNKDEIIEEIFELVEPE